MFSGIAKAEFSKDTTGIVWTKKEMKLFSIQGSNLALEGGLWKNWSIVL
jgi:hypothetical protein